MEYINMNINPADYVEVWEVQDKERGKQLVMAVDDLKYLPPADVKPVVRGEWEKRMEEKETVKVPVHTPAEPEV